MGNISTVAVIYNEEKRISWLLNTLKWCDDVILVDKSSTDKTVSIAQTYPNVRVISVPYSDGGPEMKFGVEVAKHPWIFTTVASDIMHEDVAKEALRLTDNDLPYDVIWLPFSIQVFGIDSPKSPWFLPYKPLLIRKECIISQDVLHKEVTFNSDRFYYMKLDNPEAKIYHLTHQDVKSFLERHIRYTSHEAFKAPEVTPKILRASFIQIIKSIGNVLFKSRTWLLGFDGLALAVAYISYNSLRFLFLWEKYRGTGEERYSKIRKKILGE